MNISKLFGRRSKRFSTRASDQIFDVVSIIDHFDAEFYANTYPDVANAQDLACHYASQGWREGRDPAPWFCVKAYLATYPDVAQAGIDPFAHFLLHGQSEGREALPVEGSDARGMRDFIRATGMHIATFPSGFAAAAYAQAAGLRDADRWESLAHFINNGILDPSLIAVSGADSALFAAIGDLVAEHDQNKAVRCYELAVNLGLRDGRIMHELGDVYLRREQPFHALEAYKTSISLGGSSFWTHCNLGHTYAGLGSFDDAIEQLDIALSLRPEKTTVRHQRNDIAAQRFNIEWARANALSMEHSDKAASQHMKKAIAAYQNVAVDNFKGYAFPFRARHDKLRFAIFGSDSLSQCKLYRITQKVDQLESVGQAIDVFPLSRAKDFARVVSLYDAVIIYRAPATPEVIDILALTRKFGVTTFYDIDDLIFDEACYPPTRASLDGMVTEAEYAGLVTGRSLFHEAMALCDFAIASTPPIQAAMAQVVREGKSFLSRNALGQSHLRVLQQIAATNAAKLVAAPAAKSGQPFVFFYGSGSRSHNENFAIMAPSLAKVMRTHPHTRLRVIGPVELGDTFKGLDARIEKLEFTTDLAGYWKALSSADVNLAPLTKGAFNDGKSEIKWMEAAMLGIPSVVSSSAVYDDVIRHGQDGWIVGANDNWHTILEQAVCKPKAAIGAAARERVLAEYGLAQGGENLLAILHEGLAAKASTLPVLPHKPRLLFVNIFYPPEFIGGATRVVEQIVTDLHDMHGALFDIEVFCGHEPDGRPGMVDRYLWQGVPVTMLSPFTDGDAIERSVETASFFDTYLEHVRPDIIHFHCIQRLTASLLDVAAERGVPYVVTVHDGWWISDRQFLIDEGGIPVYESGEWGDRRRIERLRNALAGGRATVAVSQSQAQLYRSCGIANTITIANGSGLLPDIVPAPEHGPVRLGLLGGLGLAKGADLLRQALQRRRYANLRFLLVDHRMLEGAVRTEFWGNNEVEIIGKASFDSVSQIYARLHVVLAISVCVESFGLVAREARQAGRWVIASNRGGIGEDVIEGENGFVIDPAKVEELLAVLDRIEASPDRFRCPPPPGAPLRSRKDVVDDYVALYKTVLDDDKKASV